MSLTQHSEFIAAHGHRLHLRRIRCDSAPPYRAVFMIHGAIENGRIFYSQSNKGLGPFLAREGWDVFVLDLRGRGLSTPTIRRGHNHGQHDSICADIPAALRYVQAQSAQPIDVVAHSWGGVMLMASLIRNAGLVAGIRRQIMFGTKRRIRVHNWERWVKLELIWHRVGPALAGFFGYFPARELKIGADNETRNYLRGVSRWVKTEAWQEAEDGFDYLQHVARGQLPDTWFMTGRADKVLGHPDDMRRFASECGYSNDDCTILGKATGYRHDYDHINILTHPDSVNDHFPAVTRWLNSGERP